MQRDMDLIRNVLLRVESAEGDEDGRVTVSPDDLGTTEAQFAYHVRLLESAGFVDIGAKLMDYTIIVDALTWKGHDFLDSVRDDEIWSKTKAAGERVGGWTVDLLAEIAKGFVRTKLKQHTGIEF